jgi:hypothetical protein
MPTQVDSLLRRTLCAFRRGRAIAGVLGKTVYAAITILIVTVGVLVAESRLPNPGPDTTSWHTSKIARVEFGGGQTMPLQAPDSWPPSRVVLPRSIAYFPPLEAVLPQLVDAPQEHGLRAPPHA